MSTILVLYASTEGQTRKIAEHIANRLSDKEHMVDVCDYARFAHPRHVDCYDAVIAGAPIYRGRHSLGFRGFIQAAVEFLNKKPTGFFSVSLSAAGDQSQRDDARNCLDALLAKTGWMPTTKAIIGGALLYRQYGFLKRLILKWIVARAYGPTDTSKNYEFTNWSEVNEFADEFASCLSLVEENRLLPSKQGRSDYSRVHLQLQ